MLLAKTKFMVLLALGNSQAFQQAAERTIPGSDGEAVKAKLENH